MVLKYVAVEMKTLQNTRREIQIRTFVEKGLMIAQQERDYQVQEQQTVAEPR